MKIILISGKAESGKDTVANLFKDALTRAGKKCAVVAFADLLKWQCKIFYEWNGIKDEAGRTLLQETADKIKSSYGEDYYANQLIKQIKIFKDEIDHLIISDWRYEEEYAAISRGFFRSKDLIITFYIDTCRKNSLAAKQQIHSSEQFTPNYSRETIIQNDGDLEALSQKLDFLIEKYKLI